MTTATGTDEEPIGSQENRTATGRRSKTEAFSTQWRNKTESLPSVWRKSSHFEMSSFHRLAYTEETGSSEVIWSLLSLFA